MTQISFVLTLAILTSACSSTDGISRANTLALQKYGTEFEIVANATDRFFLCSKREKETIPVHPLTFFVYDAERDSIVYERQIDNGSIRWLDPSHLSITTIPGNVTGEEDSDRFIEIYDVLTGRTSSH